MEEREKKFLEECYLSTRISRSKHIASKLGQSRTSRGYIVLYPKCLASKYLKIWLFKKDIMFWDYTLILGFPVFLNLNI